MNDTNSDAGERYYFVLYRTKFGIILTFQILAIFVSLIIFTFFAKHRTDRNAPQNIVLQVLLSVNFVQLVCSTPLSLYFFYIGRVYPMSAAYCSFWTAFESVLNISSDYLLATMSVQRHMLIFNGNVLRVRWMRNLLHYVPIIFCIVYPTIFYLYAMVLYPCDGTQWDFTSDICGYTDCYLMFNPGLAMFDMMANNTMPLVVDVVANAVLIARVAKHKRSFHQANTWRRHRQMTIQLFCVSSLFICAWAPCLIVQMVESLRDPTFLVQIQRDFLLDIVNIEYLLMPWLFLLFIPELSKWIKKLGEKKPRNTVGTTNIQQYGNGTTDQRKIVATTQIYPIESKI